jgi:hypothetical protein
MAHLAAAAKISSSARNCSSADSKTRDDASRKKQHSSRRDPQGVATSKETWQDRVSLVLLDSDSTIDILRTHAVQRHFPKGNALSHDARKGK